MSDTANPSRTRTIAWDDPRPTAQGRVVDEAGRLYAHATTTCLLLEAKG